MTRSKALVAAPEPTLTTRSHATAAQLPQQDECMRPETPQEPPKQRKKTAHKPQKTQSFQDPFSNSTPTMYTPDHSVAESEARGRHRASAPNTSDIETLPSHATTSASSEEPASSSSNSTPPPKGPTIDPGLLKSQVVKPPVSFSLSAKPKKSPAVSKPPPKSTRLFLAPKKASESTTSLFSLSNSRAQSQTPNNPGSQAFFSSLPSSSRLALPATSGDPICPTITSNDECRSTPPAEHPFRTVTTSPRISPPTVSSQLPTTVKILSKSSKNIPRAVTDTLLSLESEVTVLREDQEALQIKNNRLEKELHDLSLKYEAVLQQIQVFADRFSSYELRLSANSSDGADVKAEPATGSVKAATKNNIFNVSVSLCSLQLNSLLYSLDWCSQHISHCHRVDQELCHLQHASTQRRRILCHRPRD